MAYPDPDRPAKRHGHPAERRHAARHGRSAGGGRRLPRGPHHRSAPGDGGRHAGQGSRSLRPLGDHEQPALPPDPDAHGGRGHRPRGCPRPALRRGVGGGPLGAAAPSRCPAISECSRPKPWKRPSGPPESISPTPAPWRWRTLTTGAAAPSGRSRPCRRYPRSPANGASRSISTGPGCGTRTWPPGWRSRTTRPPRTRCRCASPRAWGRLWGPSWPGPTSSWRGPGTTASATAAR